MRQHSGTSSFYGGETRRRVGDRLAGARGVVGWLRHSLPWRLALLLLCVLFVCATAVGIAFQFRQQLLEPPAASVYRVAFHLTDAVGNTPDGRRVSASATAAGPADAQRQHLSSNLSVLLHGSWPPGARFHPTSFEAEIAVLNRTVHCDRPSQSDAALVYSEPTWLCKNIRIGGQGQAVDAEGSGDLTAPQRLPFSDTTSRTLEEMMMTRQKELLGSAWSPSDACGHLPDRRDNVLLLCDLLLAGVRRLSLGRDRRAPAALPLASSAHIPYGNCSLPEQKRVLLVGMATEDAVWYTEKNWKAGFVTDLYCSFAD